MRLRLNGDGVDEVHCIMLSREQFMNNPLFKQLLASLLE